MKLKLHPKQIIMLIQNGMLKVQPLIINGISSNILVKYMKQNNIEL
jgi:hypothetical protein